MSFLRKSLEARGDFHDVVHCDLNDTFNLEVFANVYENFPKFRMGRRMADQYPAIPFKTEFNTTPLRKDNQRQIGK
jgi:hypothetical protein